MIQRNNKKRVRNIEYEGVVFMNGREDSIFNTVYY